MQGFENIIIAGYPKSGTTWLTRLVAELMKCPVAGFWRSDHDEIAIEGQDRPSNISCWKAHHKYEDLGLKDQKTKIIYIIRDPRDVLSSGISYFQIHRFPTLETWLNTFSVGRWVHKFLFVRQNRNYMIRRMTNALLNGDMDIHEWCKIPWNDHINSFERDNVLTIKFENLYLNPVETATTVLDYLETVRSKPDIEEAIFNQSFAQRRHLARLKGDLRNLRFLRKGLPGQFRHDLNKHQQNFVNENLLELLRAFDYD